MQQKIMKLTMILVVLFSLQASAQTTEPSKHPKMDKYYPPPPQPVTPDPTPEIKPTPVITTTATPQTISKPAPSTSTITPTVISQPVAQTPIPQDTTTKETPVVAVEKPAVVVPLPQKISVPPSELYNPNRLGSSTKQYDTWEKNSNGAGSVTTHSK